MSFEQALSGLNAASQNLDVIGNNVANASTTGFKEGQAQFADMYAASMATTSQTQIGIGVNVAAVAQQFTQGNITTTGNPMDVAINGQGFFIMNTNGVNTYSRDGEFSLNSQGYIVNSSGAQLTGYPASANGTISPSTPTPIQLSLQNIAPQATANASLSVNLNSGSTAPTSAFNINDPTTYNSSTAMTVYDSLGNAHTLSVYFVDTSTAGTWNVYAASDGSVLNGGASIGSLNFNSSGTMTSSVTLNPQIPLTNGANSPLSFNLLFPSTSNTQYGSSFAVSSNTQDGYTTGQLSGFTINSDGTIQGSYTNGQTRIQGQIALANFINPQGLIAMNGNQWQQSASSGQPVIGPPSTGANGALQSGALESSNVDITTELVNMITAQRVYQANAETIKTEDQVQQTLMNLR